jgi:hypothetical protein
MNMRVTKKLGGKIMKKMKNNKVIAGLGLTSALLFTSFYSTHISANSINIKEKMMQIKKQPHISKSAVLSKKFNILKNRPKAEVSIADLQTNLEQEPNDLPDDATFMPLDKNQAMIGDFSSVNTDYGQDLDFYRISVTKSGELLLVGGTQDPTDINTELIYGLVDSNMQVVDADYADLDENGYLDEAYNVQPGTYYVLAFNGTGQYTYTPYALVGTLADITPPAAPKVNSVDDNDLKITGTAESGSIVTVKTGTTKIGSVKASNGKFSLILKSHLKAKTKLSITATDAAGNVSKTTSVTVVDKTAPTLTINKVYSKNKYVSGKTEANATVTVKYGSKTLGSKKADSKGNFKITIRTQKKGVTLSVSSTDAAKNTKTVKVKVY